MAKPKIVINVELHPNGGAFLRVASSEPVNVQVIDWTGSKGEVSVDMPDFGGEAAIYTLFAGSLESPPSPIAEVLAELEANAD